MSQPADQHKPQAQSFSGQQRPSIRRQQSDLILSTALANTSSIKPPPTTDSSHDLSSPPLYRNIPPSSADPYSASSATTNTFSPNQHNFHFPPFPSTTIPHHAVSNLDRQMVFGAYAGIDPGTMSLPEDFGTAGTNWGNMNDPNALNFPFQPGDPNLDGMDPSTDPGKSEAWQDANMGFGHNDGSAMSMSGGYQGIGGGSMGMGSTAFFMPFNMEPPNFGTSGGAPGELGAGQLDGMDFGISPSGTSSVLGDLGQGQGGI
jgi:hypothetical protein